jgi:uncharacterized membrane protein
MIPWDIIIVRALHIFAAVIWVGGGLLFSLLLNRIMANGGPQVGGGVVRAIYLHSPFLKVISTAAITTTVAGLYMYGRRETGTLVISGDTTQQIVLGIGALFGLMALGHGLFLARLGQKYTAIAKEAGENPTQEQIGEMAALGQKIGRNGPIVSILMIIALIGMILPRYMAGF